MLSEQHAENERKPSPVSGSGAGQRLSTKANSVHATQLMVTKPIVSEVHRSKDSWCVCEGGGWGASVGVGATVLRV